MFWLIKDLADYFFPLRCHGCGSVLAGDEEGLCALCRYELPRTLYHTLQLNPMEEKLAGGVPFRRATALCFYTPGSMVSRIVKDFKYNSFPLLAREMGRQLARELGASGFLSDVDVLQPVAMHWWRRAKRGYNQAEQLALGVSEETGIPVGDNLRATRMHISQTRKGAAERERNMRGYFKAVNTGEIENKHILIIDDVCTTGATLRQAGAALTGIEGVSISYLSLATV